uniref:Putative secreted protein n=1 Tax=Anopheles marajoara TaxID=58244 RepID=A0A2M4C7M6_9DIPT
MVKRLVWRRVVLSRFFTSSLRISMTARAALGNSLSKNSHNWAGTGRKTRNSLLMDHHHLVLTMAPYRGRGMHYIENGGHPIDPSCQKIYTLSYRGGAVRTEYLQTEQHLEHTRMMPSGGDAVAD